MTREQTIKVLELLNAFYAGGKNDPKQQVVAWHLILCDYDFEDTMNAVLNYAKNDRREYAQFPTVGRIIQEIERTAKLKESFINEVIKSIAYGRDYESMTSPAKLLIKRESYDEWKAMDAEEFAMQSLILAEALRDAQKQLKLKG